MTEKVLKGARLGPERARRVDLMAALDVEFPDGASAVIRLGIDLAWAIYGKLALAMADAKQRARQEAADV